MIFIGQLPPLAACILARLVASLKRSNANLESLQERARWAVGDAR